MRMHTVMGHTVASLWCSSHGPEHCLWSGRAWRESDDPRLILEALADAASEAYHRGQRGQLPELTDECGL